MLIYAVGTFVFSHFFTHRMPKFGGHMTAIGIEGAMKFISVLLAVCMLVMHIRIYKQRPLTLIDFF
jgi:hypothetical protein